MAPDSTKETPAREDRKDSNSIKDASASLDKHSSAKKRSRRRRKAKSRAQVEPLAAANSTPKKQHDAPMTKRDLYFALDCEMVGVGPDGLSSAVARVSIVNWDNQVILDTYVEVPVPVTDYRTHVSGITPEHLKPRLGHSLMTFSEVRETVQTILRGKILIGHGLENDLKALGLYHPWCDIRDSATYSYYMREHRDPMTDCITLVPKKLRDLAWDILKRQIQDPGAPHSPIEDAIAALDLYKECRGQWEDHLIQLARQKEMEQEQQLLETRQRQQEHEQQQMRRWQWLGGGGGVPQTMYPCGLPAHPQQIPPQLMGVPMMQQPPPSFYCNPAMAAPLIPMHQSSQAAAAYLQGQHSHQQQQSQQRSSWFGFSRRPKNNESETTPSLDYASVGTSPTMTTVQSSFSTDQSVASPPRTAALRVQQEVEPYAMAENAFETVLGADVVEGDAVEAPVNVKQSNAADDDGDDHDDEPKTEPTEESSLSSSLPNYYVPPRYFTNEDPNPTISSSWFKLWGSSNKSYKNGGDAEWDNSSEKERKRRSSDSEATMLSLFSPMSLFPRRASESCMTDLAEEDGQHECSRSMH